MTNIEAGIEALREAADLARRDAEAADRNADAHERTAACLRRGAQMHRDKADQIDAAIEALTRANAAAT